MQRIGWARPTSLKCSGSDGKMTPQWCGRGPKPERETCPRRLRVRDTSLFCRLAARAHASVNSRRIRLSLHNTSCNYAKSNGLRERERERERFAYATVFVVCLFVCFNPTVEVVTFRLRRLCWLNGFLWPASPHQRHECQDLWAHATECMCAHTWLRSLLSSKRFCLFVCFRESIQNAC